MDINVKVKLESPELMAAILALAEALPRVQLSGFKSIEDVQAIKVNGMGLEVKADVTKEEAKVIALEEVRAKLASISKSGKQKEVKALIQKYGAKKLTEIGSHDYEALLKDAEAI